MLEENTVEIVRTVPEMQRRALTLKRAGERIGFVPTMGYLHEGHLSLVDAARQRSSFVVVSIFVNPTQFGPNEDLDRYPRDFERDRSLLEARGVDLLFAPEAADLYPEGYQTYVTVERVTQRLCGRSRPTHFRGVTTIVAKLFHIVQPDLAFFGEKDYQQLVTIRRMVEDLNFPVEVVGMPTVREADGLAMSSRNVNLTPAQRSAAAAIPRALEVARECFLDGERSAQTLRGIIEGILEAQAYGEIDYVEICDPESLEPLDRIEEDALIAVAVRFEGARLIDNIRLQGRSRGER